MPIKTRPVYDCTSCDAYEAQANDPRRGWCHRNPPTGQITGMDQFGKPQVASVVPPVGKGVWCLQHPMAKAFPPGAFEAKPLGETAPLVADATIINGLPEPIPPKPGTLVVADDPPDELLPGEARPEKAN